VKRLALWLFPALLLSACATAPQRPSQDVLQQAWRDRQAQLARLDQWNLEGRVAVSTPTDGWQASLRWRQQADGHYAIRIIAPLGQGSVALDGGPDGVVMRTTEHPRPVTAADAETLLYDRLGWRVPVAGLRYWILGLPDPKLEAPELELDNEGRLASLTQDGWQVEYRGYQQVGAYQLPGKIFMENNSLKLRMVIRTWSLGG